MSWLRTTSLSFARQLSRSLDPRSDYEPQACYSSFCKHWQQAHDIIVKSEPQHLHDDVLGVVNHLEQLCTLLVLEARAKEVNNTRIGTPSACLEFLLSENLLDKLYEWAICTGKYENAVRLEQLKLYGHLVSHYNVQVIAAEPFLRPLLKLLSGFRNELPPSNIEHRLVLLLNQLCVTLMQNIKFIDLFFLTTHTHNGSQNEFILVRLLLCSVHREGATGASARDALLLCAKMSAKCEQLADYILNVSNACPVLATGLSGLYSLLPRTLYNRIHRLSPDDVNQVHKLTLFIDSLEFCNAVAQVAHPSIKKHLLDLLFQGFLVPVLGPALLQTKVGTLQNGAAEQVAATAYLELCVRSVTPRGLLKPILEFLIKYRYDGVKVMNVIIKRLDESMNLSLVSLGLIDTLIDLNCEDVMIELVFKYIRKGYHLMPSYRNNIADPQTYRDAATALLSITPKSSQRPAYLTRAFVEDLAATGKRVLDFRPKDETDRRGNRFNDQNIAMNNLVQEVNFNYGNPNETLFGNHHAYLCDARFEIVSRILGCSNWSSKYDGKENPKTDNNATTSKETETLKSEKEQDSGYETLKSDAPNSDSSEKEMHSLSSLVDIDKIDSKHNSLTSCGESSGYESFKYRGEEVEEVEGYVEDNFWKCTSKGHAIRVFDGFIPPTRMWKDGAENIIGPLLSWLLRKAANILSGDVTMNVIVSGIISKLVAFPTPLLTILLINKGFMLEANVPSLFQILSNSRKEIDLLTDFVSNPNKTVDQARVYLIRREMSLVNPRVVVNEEKKCTCKEDAESKRAEAKRRSLSDSISSMFGRRLSNSSNTENRVATPVAKTYCFTEEPFWSGSIMVRAILNSIILDEWLKEMASLAEEHALRLSADYYEDEVYLKAVGL